MWCSCSHIKFVFLKWLFFFQASEILSDQTNVRLAERRERRTDYVMNQWANRNGHVGELIGLLERQQLLRARDVILTCEFIIYLYVYIYMCIHIYVYVYTHTNAQLKITFDFTSCFLSGRASSVSRLPPHSCCSQFHSAPKTHLDTCSLPTENLSRGTHTHTHIHIHTHTLGWVL